MDDALQNRCVKCPTCGDVFTIKRGLVLASSTGEGGAGRDTGRERRDSDRANTVSIRILYDATLREFPVKDITPKSLGIYHLGWRFDLGRSIHFDLIEGYKFLLKGVTAKVVRVDDETIGALFENVLEEEIVPIYSAALTRIEEHGTVAGGFGGADGVEEGLGE